MEVSEKESETIRWFTALGYDPIHGGYLSSKMGAIIRLPATFSYQSTDDVDRTTINMYRDKSICWSSEAGTVLTNSLLLSDSARKFAIAREVRGVQATEVRAIDAIEGIRCKTVEHISMAVRGKRTFSLFRKENRNKLSNQLIW